MLQSLREARAQLRFRLNNCCNYRILCFCETGSCVSLRGGLGWAFMPVLRGDDPKRSWDLAEAW